MTEQEIGHVIALMERHGIASFDYEADNIRLCLTSDDALLSSITAPRVDHPPPHIPAVFDVTSPCVGFFLLAHPALNAPPAAFPRDVANGEIVGYIRSGVTLRAVQASAACRLLRPLINAGDGVSFGDRLFETTA